MVTIIKTLTEPRPATHYEITLSKALGITVEEFRDLQWALAQKKYRK